MRSAILHSLKQRSSANGVVVSVLTGYVAEHGDDPIWDDSED